MPAQSACARCPPDPGYGGRREVSQYFVADVSVLSVSFIAELDERRYMPPGSTVRDVYYGKGSARYGKVTSAGGAARPGRPKRQ